jgi:dTDP-glucose 4,6-dehydratase
LTANYAIGNFISDAMAKRDITINGDGSPLRSYLYAADLVVWLLAILSRGRTGVPYNVGGEAVVTLAELAKIVAQCAEAPVGIIVTKAVTKGAKRNVYVPSVVRAMTELRLGETLSLKDSIYKTMAWVSNAS